MTLFRQAIIILMIPRGSLSESVRTVGNACIITTTVSLEIYIGNGNYLRIHDGQSLVCLLIKMEFST